MNKLFLSSFYWLMLGAFLWADSPSTARGVMILTSASGLDPRNILFSGQVWTGFDGGTVIDSNGQRSDFAKKDIGKVIYFDSNYYGQLDNDQQEKAFRAGIQAREVVVNTFFLNLDTSIELKAIQDSQGNLLSLVHEYPAIQSLVQPQLDLLQADITRLSNGQSLVNGQWMSQQEAAAQRAVPLVGDTNKPVNFTTKDGKHFISAKVSLTDTSLSVLTSDGGASIPFDQLPDDLSGFPDAVRKVIIQKRQVMTANEPMPTAPAHASEAITLSVSGSLAGGPSTQDTASSTQAQAEAAERSSDTNEKASQDSPITEFESAIISKYSQEQIRDNQVRSKLFQQIRANQGRSGESNYFVPTFSDEFPPTIHSDGKNAVETIQYINRKLIDNKIIYYDSRLKTFISGTLVFTSNGRIRLEKWPIITFNTCDLNPEKMEKTTANNETLVWVCTTDNKKTIGGLTYNGLAISSDGFSLPVEDDHDAQSICNAMTHLIQLYGGKAEDF